MQDGTTALLKAATKGFSDVIEELLKFSPSLGLLKASIEKIEYNLGRGGADHAFTYSPHIRQGLCGGFHIHQMGNFLELHIQSNPILVAITCVFCYQRQEVETLCFETC